MPGALDLNGKTWTLNKGSGAEELMAFAMGWLWVLGLALAPGPYLLGGCLFIWWGMGKSIYLGGIIYMKAKELAPAHPGPFTALLIL